MDAPAARVVAAALPRLPALRALELSDLALLDAAAAELFRAASAEAAPQLRSLAFKSAGLSTAAACALAATGWRLEELDLRMNE